MKASPFHDEASLRGTLYRYLRRFISICLRRRLYGSNPPSLPLSRASWGTGLLLVQTSPNTWKFGREIRWLASSTIFFTTSYDYYNTSYISAALSTKACVSYQIWIPLLHSALGATIAQLVLALLVACELRSVNPQIVMLPVDGNCAYVLFFKRLLELHELVISRVPILGGCWVELHYSRNWA